MPLLCEAVGRGAGRSLRPAEVDVVDTRARWACRELKAVVGELGQWTAGVPTSRSLGPGVGTLGREILDAQEQLGPLVRDWLDDSHPEWLEELAEDTWNLIGGW